MVSSCRLTAQIRMIPGGPYSSGNPSIENVNVIDRSDENVDTCKRG